MQTFPVQSNHENNLARELQLKIPPDLSPAQRQPRLPALLALCAGIGLTLVIHGYQFARSNHSVYLLDAQRRADPQLLQNDWFTTQTLQYHAAFAWVTDGLMRLRLLESGFLIGYLLLVVLLHLAWLRLVIAIGAGLRVYLLSVVLYYLSAGGTALGMYQFMQDSSFLPSNIANVAMLWALLLWSRGQFAWSGLCFGIAGMFHLNHAAVGVGLWVALSGWLWYSDRDRARSLFTPQFLVGTGAAIVPSLIGLAVVARMKLGQASSVPLDEFVDLFVRLRHPHHYDLRSWPAGLWLAFAWPIPLGWLALRRLKREATASQAAMLVQLQRVFALLGGLLIVAFLGAGIWYVSEALIQLSLYRFAIYLQLFACIGAAVWLARRPRTTTSLLWAVPIVLLGAWFFLPQAWPAAQLLEPHRRHALLAVALLCCIAAMHHHLRHVLAGAGAMVLIAVTIIAGHGRWTGLLMAPTLDDAEYAQLCHRIADAKLTDPDAIFLVPPDETLFRLHAQRAIVVNFKGVPQLSSELPHWRDRLQHVIDMPDLRPLITGNFVTTLQQIRQRYNALDDPTLLRIARQSGARYVVTERRIDPAHPATLITTSAAGRYFLYDLGL